MDDYLFGLLYFLRVKNPPSLLLRLTSTGTIIDFLLKVQLRYKFTLYLEILKGSDSIFCFYLDACLVNRNFKNIKLCFCFS